MKDVKLMDKKKMNDGYANWQFFVKKCCGEAMISNHKLW
jgi:hypothetical protein